MHDMLRIMDVASALRRERETAEAQLDVATAKVRLRERLLATAAASGEPVTTAEVDAAIEQYFASQHRYEDPPPSWKRFRAHLWVMRFSCLFLAVLVVSCTFGVMALVGAFANESPSVAHKPVVVVPATQPSAPVPTPTPLPTPKPSADAQLAAAWQSFQTTRAAAEKVASDDDARQRVQAAIVAGEAAHAGENLQELKDAQAAMATLAARLREAYEVRIISRPGEDSGVERLSNGATSGRYVVVEAVTENGRVLTRRIRHGETGAYVDVRKWGEQISDAVWARVVADKRADGIVDEALFARKVAGSYDDVVVLDDGTGKPLRRGRQITQW